MRRTWLIRRSSGRKPASLLLSMELVDKRRCQSGTPRGSNVNSHSRDLEHLGSCSEHVLSKLRVAFQSESILSSRTPSSHAIQSTE
jgi:hypothetical protein